MLEVKSVVESQKGHDKGRKYVVVNIKGEFAYVCDGDYRTLDNPKKKRIKHLLDTHEKCSIDKNIDDFYDYEITTFLKNFDKMHKN